jgi:hypothetical protein
MTRAVRRHDFSRKRHGVRQPSPIALEVEVKLLREMLDAMRDDRDAWREQAAKMTGGAVLTSSGYRA